MNSILLRAVLPSLFFAASALAQGAAPVPADEIDPKQIASELVPDKSPIMVGEPVYATLILKNNSATAVTVFAYKDDATGANVSMAGNIALTAVDKDGVKAPSPPPAKEPNGDTGIDFFDKLEIPAAGSISLRLYLPLWVIFKHPGNYTLTVATRFRYFKKDRGDLKWLPVKVTAALAVTPADKKKMAKLIDELEKLAQAVPLEMRPDDPPGWVEGREARRKLQSINDERTTTTR